MVGVCPVPDPIFTARTKLPSMGEALRGVLIGAGYCDGVGEIKVEGLFSHGRTPAKLRLCSVRKYS
ncbi:hypothetical protein MOX02_56550 [Methylobacterium oxalidis]|uniref:Uncharacterized protein n=1 Tax=Methylobacterium oxalidis TaxID=944322 RepID=A0A512JCH5_9HYPH|nr:hypothetical protein MOX02_56550 [Methylobacterium oxalidis]GLS65550.1 hypothetical protein GCM10007888_39320 [Methylobacterium oxalidis]